MRHSFIPHHEIVEHNDHKMVLQHFTRGHKIVIAQRANESGTWTVTPVGGSPRIKEVIAADRNAAIDAIKEIALALGRETGEINKDLPGYSMWVPTNGQRLRDKP